jgi:predicted esterase
MLFIPKEVSSTLPSTFLVCLLGMGISAKQDINNWAFYAAKNGFIVVALDVNYSLIRSISDVDTLYLKISGILASLKNEYSLANNEVCIAGISAGGMMSIALGLRYPDKFLGVGVVSGAKFNFGAEGNLKNARGKRFCIVHGGNDKIVPLSEFYSTKAELEQNGALVQSKVFPEGEHTLPSSAYQEIIDWLPKLR